MSKKKVILVASGLLLAAGAAVAISAPGDRGHWRRGQMEFGHDRDMGGRFRGMFGRAVTKDDFDARTRERFARLDKNSDGVIDAAEIEAAFTGRSERFRKGPKGDMRGRMGERMLQRFDANKDGKVTKDEYQATIRKMFAEIDLNNDGRIADDDLPPMMRGRNVLAGEGGRMGGRGMPMMELLRGADANKDGVITLDEVLAAADKRFALFDRNKDGGVDKADFDALRKETAEYRVKRFIHSYGADKDGKVTRELFAAKAAERFARMDLNSDGTIARDEMPGRGRWFGGGRRGGPDGMMREQRDGMPGPGGEQAPAPDRGQPPGKR